MTMLNNPMGWSKKRKKARQRRESRNSAERAQVRATRAEAYRKRRQVLEAERKAEEAARPDNAGPTTVADVLPKVGRVEEVQGSAEPAQPIEGRKAEAFDLSGNWMQTRAAVKDTLGLDKAPKSKADAAKLLTEAGYTVEGHDAS